MLYTPLKGSTHSFYRNTILCSLLLCLPTFSASYGEGNSTGKPVRVQVQETLQGKQKVQNELGTLIQKAETEKGPLPFTIFITLVTVPIIGLVGNFWNSPHKRTRKGWAIAGIVAGSLGSSAAIGWMLYEALQKPVANDMDDVVLSMGIIVMLNSILIGVGIAKLVHEKSRGKAQVQRGPIPEMGKDERPAGETILLFAGTN